MVSESTECENSLVGLLSQALFAGYSLVRCFPFFLGCLFLVSSFVSACISPVLVKLQKWKIFGIPNDPAWD